MDRNHYLESCLLISVDLYFSLIRFNERLAVSQGNFLFTFFMLIFTIKIFRCGFA